MKKYVILLSALSFSAFSYALDLKDCQMTPYQQKISLHQYLPFGEISEHEIFPRRAYALSYNDKYMVPRWASWTASSNNRDTPKRRNRWSRFRTDPQIPFVDDADYKGWYKSQFNFARGHMVPYFIAGGDRDMNGKDAEIEETLEVEDVYDACVVYEINAMSNIVPQYHDRFNGSGGLWYELESTMRSILDRSSDLFHIVAGTIFLPDQPVGKIGNLDEDPSTWSIGVPHGFFKLITNMESYETVAFIFDHSFDVKSGCSLDTAHLSDCIVSIDQLETLTGYQFFVNQDDRLPDPKTSTVETFYSW